MNGEITLEELHPDLKMQVEGTTATQDAIKQGVDTANLKLDAGIGKVLKARTFNANGTFTVPAGVTEVYLTGGGAGGGGASFYTPSPGANTQMFSGNTGGATSFGNLLTLPGGAGGGVDYNGGKGGLPGGKGGASGSNSLTVSGGASGSIGGAGGSGGYYSGGGANGGKGAYCSGGAGAGGGFHGGGGGDFVIDYPVQVTSGQSIAVTIGTGGAPHIANGGAGGDGILTVKWWE